jgi:hypothetical protein
MSERDDAREERARVRAWRESEGGWRDVAEAFKAERDAMELRALEAEAALADLLEHRGRPWTDRRRAVENAAEIVRSRRSPFTSRAPENPA